MSRKPCILVCDDNDDILGFLRVVLRNAGFDVVTAHGESETFEALKSCSPDVFILDICMPESDGFWLAQELQSRGHDKPIIFMTAFDEPGNRMNAPAIGAVEYLVKPLDIEQLLQKVHKALREPLPAPNWGLEVTACAAHMT